METIRIAALLGQPSAAAQVDAALTHFGVTERPALTIDPDDPDGPVVTVQSWVGNLLLGIEFGFDDEAAWRGWDEFERGRHPMLLTQIYFYCDHQGVRPYPAPLPCGLLGSDDRRTVRAKMAQWTRTCRAYQRDVWRLPEFDLVGSYVAGDTHLDFLLCMLHEPALPQRGYGLAPVPGIGEIVGLIGSSCDDPAFRQAFDPLGLGNQLQDVEQRLTAELRRTYGLDLGFRAPAAPAASAVFSHVMFYRARELDARGWPGALPLGIAFDDSPEVALQKAGLAPDEHRDEDFTGYALWHFPDYSLYLFYSTMENVILRVRVMAPGAWEAWQQA